MDKTYIIAEIGINHNGDVEIAKRLMDIAAVAGCDAVKFQKRNPDIAVPEDQKSVMRETPWGTMTYLDYKHKMEFGDTEYDELSWHSALRGIDWSASVWDLDSLEFMKQYAVPFLKIPSAKLTDLELIEKTAAYCKEIDISLIVSTGMSTLEEVDNCVKVVVSTMGSKKNFILMHCNSTYPASIDELNLSCIRSMYNRYRCTLGYSGHEFRLGTTVSAVYLGASVIERHITLDRSMWGTDHLSSIEPQGLFKLVSGIRELERAYGDGSKKVFESEMPIRKKLRGY